MEIIGDDKRLKALYSETRFADEPSAPSFSATWYHAQSRATQPNRALKLASAWALALLIVAVATFAFWSKYSQPTQMYSAYASPAAAEIVPLSSKRNSETAQPSLPAPVKYSTSSKSRRRKLATQPQQLMIAENRKATKAAKEIASWQSPTASLLSSSSDDIFRSLPQLNESATELKSFLPNRSNDKEY